VNDLYNENYKIMIKEIEEDTHPPPKKMEKHPMFMDWKN
jgi:hypothetical protein